MRMMLLGLVLLCDGANAISISPFISEIHYDNRGTDVSEFIEITGADTDLAAWSLAFYNGANGLVYEVLPVAGRLDDRLQALAFFPSFSIQNGPSDGVALLDGNSDVVDFISYEGQLRAFDGPAASLNARELPVHETANTPLGYSLQRTSLRDPAQWRAAPATPGVVNVGLLPLPGSLVLMLVGISLVRRIRV